MLFVFDFLFFLFEKLYICLRLFYTDNNIKHSQQIPHLHTQQQTGEHEMRATGWNIWIKHTADLTNHTNCYILFCFPLAKFNRITSKFCSDPSHKEEQKLKQSRFLWNWNFASLRNYFREFFFLLFHFKLIYVVCNLFPI